MWCVEENVDFQKLSAVILSIMHVSTPFTLLLLPLLALAQDLSHIKVHVTPLSHTGNRCLGTDEAILSTGLISNSTGPVLYHALPFFRPLFGSGIAASEQRAMCQVYLNMTFSEPNTRVYVNTYGMDMRGYLPLTEYQRATFKVTYDWVDTFLQVRV